MLSVKLFLVNAVIDNLLNWVCVEEVPMFIDVYLEMLDHLIHLRRSLRAAR